VDDADSAEAVALLWTLIEQTDCVATSELGDVGVIAVVLFGEIVRIAGSVLMGEPGARAAGRSSRADELDVVKDTGASRRDSPSSRCSGHKTAARCRRTPRLEML